MGKFVIGVERYCWAFETWAEVARRPDWEKRVLREGLAHLRQRFQGEAETATLCEAFTAWARGQAMLPPGLELGISKSCLLDRLIYAGEPLRTRPCPLHGGRWSGYWSDAPCPEGCSFGLNLTGWLPEPGR